MYSHAHDVCDIPVLHCSNMLPKNEDCEEEDGFDSRE